ncbi:PhzA/PhzB family protein, partial [Pseudomonas aeruginosa]
ESGEPLVFRGHESLRRLAEWLERCFPDWEWHNVRIFETEDPNHYWVECDGRGKVLFPGYPEGYYENHFLHSFELEDGKIKRNREFMNVFQQLRSL